MKKKDVKKLVYCVSALVITIGVLKLFSVSFLITKQRAAVTDSSVSLSTGCVPTSVTKCGKIIITKDAIPDSYQDFSFVHTVPGYPSPFILDDDGTLTNPSTLPNQQIINTPPSGTFTVTEQSIQSAWNPETNQFEGGYTVNIQCADPSGGTITSGTSATLSLSGAETIKCSFKNSSVTTQACSASWTQRANFPTTNRRNAVAFSIGTKGYVGTGISLPYSTDYGYRRDFWEYNPDTNIWTQKADFGGTGRRDAVAFTINGKGYVGTGARHNPFTTFADFWEYDPVVNIWTQLANFAGSAREDAVGFSIGSKGYVGTGLNNVGSVTQDFWEYDPATDAWAQRAGLPGSARKQAVGFSIGSKGYVGTGVASNPQNKFNDFWEYDPVGNAWIQKAPLTGGRSDAVGFSIGSKGYIGTGLGYTANYRDMWEYDSTNNSWTQKPDYIGMIQRGFSFVTDGKGYVGGGEDIDYYDNYDSENDLWRFCP